MDNLTDNEIQVIRYIEGDMTESEKNDFENLVHNSPDLEELCKEYKVIFKAIEESGDKEFRSAIQHVEQELSGQDFFIGKNKVRQNGDAYIFNTWQRLAIAAAIFLFIASIVFLWLTNSNTSGQALFAKYYAPETVQTQKILEQFGQKGFIQTPGPTDSISDCIKLYKDKKYTECIALIHSFSKELASTQIVSFYLGLSFLEVLNFEKATPILASLCQDSTFEWNDDACWYYGLALLGQGTKREATRTVFTQISNSVHSKYRSQAKEIISTLDK